MQRGDTRTTSGPVPAAKRLQTQGNPADELLPSLPAVAGEITEPDPSRTAEAFAQSGYRFENAIADLIDNSLDAEARTVLIRFITNSKAVQRIVVADDGGGMDEGHLREAMRIGGRFERRKTDLGKFGVGMKSASLSQCRSLSVISRRGGKVAGRRWTEESIRNGWTCEILDPKAATEYAGRDWGPVHLDRRGTLIIWDGLDRLRTHRDGVQATVTELFKRMNNSLGLTFHRFLKSGRFRIILDSVDSARSERGLPCYVEPLDPFGYDFSGAPGYPRSFTIDLGEGINLELRAHIWPPKAKSPEYRLGGGQVASRQGFYFYRNRRLIQAGGWNGWRESDNEPHFSLARVQIDLPIESDRAFGLSLHKSVIDAPSHFLAALDQARSDTFSLKDYVRTAEETYRSAESIPGDRSVKPIPGLGLAPTVRNQARKLMAGKDKSVREFRFRWENMPPSRFFDIDREDDIILLNERYRRVALGDRRESANDAALLKTLLFLALRPHLTRQRISTEVAREIENMNRLLTAAVSEDQ